MGIPQGIAREYNQADAKTGILRKKRKKGNANGVTAGSADIGGR
jgi:hypothetical protein